MRQDVEIATQSYIMKNNEYFMRAALKEAQKAYEKDEIPVGAVIVFEDKIIARAHNLKETKKKATAHAEILAIEKASKKIGDYRLNGCKLYVTLEPCCMCAGAIISARIDEVYYGAKDLRFGAHESFINVFDYNFNHKVKITSGILKEESASLIKAFFKKLRNEDKEA